MEFLKAFKAIHHGVLWAAQYFLSFFRNVEAENRLLHPFPRFTQTRNLHSPTRLNMLLSVLQRGGSYLEVGIEKGWTIQAVRSQHRVGVDPQPRFSLESLPGSVEVFHGTSDDFFSSNSADFSLIFLDGLHEALQTYKDFCHATRILVPSGVILIDDVFPSDEYSAHPVEAVSNELKRGAGIAHRAWYGDVWKVVLIINQFHPDWKIAILGGRDHGHGQAVVTRSNGERSAAEFDSRAVRFAQTLEYSHYFGGSSDVIASMVVDERRFLEPSNLRDWLGLSR